jgi:hypothetical protein
MRICRLIATASKHFDVEEKFADPTMSTALVHFRTGEMLRTPWIIEWHAEVGPASFPARGIFRRDLRFWDQVLIGVGLREDHFFTAGPIDSDWHAEYSVRGRNQGWILNRRQS